MGVLLVSHLFVFFLLFSSIYGKSPRPRGWAKLLYAITCVGTLTMTLRSIFRGRRYPLFPPTPTTPVVSEGNCARQGRLLGTFRVSG